MAHIERKMNITYRWWNDSLNKIDPGHAEALEETACDLIPKQMAEGFICGELWDNIKMYESDPEEGISYKGWWEITKDLIEKE